MYYNSFWTIIMIVAKVGGDIQMSMDINEAIKEDIQVMC